MDKVDDQLVPGGDTANGFRGNDVASNEHQNELDRLSSLVSSDHGERTYFVDFDHTLYLSNSTESFVGAAHPASILGSVMKALGVVRPWKLFGKNGTFAFRDTIRFLVLFLFAPWTYAIFKRRAPQLWKQFRNEQLETVLGQVNPQKIVIVSFGFGFVVRALLKGTRYENSKVIAPSLFSSASFRLKGKLKAIQQAMPAANFARDVLVTDNPNDDRDVVDAFEQAIVIDWPEAHTKGGLENAYIPFFYTAAIKRSPGFLIKQIGLEEMPIVILAFGFVAASFNVTLLASLALLFAAYKVVYEIGYAENDRVGLQKEAEPKLSENFYKMKDYRLEPFAWAYSIVLAALGIWVLDDAALQMSLTHLQSFGVEFAQTPKLFLFALAMSVIIAGRIVFWVFNSASLRTRVFVYIPLHMTKYIGWLVLFPISIIGAVLIMAQIVRTWAMYAIRRAGGDVDFLPSQLVRICFFAMFMGVLIIMQQSFGEFTTLQAALIVAFCVLRAIPEVWRKLIKSSANTAPSTKRQTSQLSEPSVGSR